jgi:acetyltransferase AlgX (SGNH hydrolase-like protein)
MQDTRKLGGAGLPEALSRLGPSLFRFAGVALWSYICFALLLGERIAGITFGALPTLLLLVVGIAALLMTPRLVRRTLSPSRMFEVGVAGVIVFGGILLIDVVYTAVRNGQGMHARAVIGTDQREADWHVWHGELFPRSYFPTEKNFFLYKPDVRLSALTYGEHYQPSMLASPTLRDSVLEPHRLSYVIGPHGLRELEPLTGTRVFALGDSFVFGAATNEGKTWVDLLGAALGEPVYNLGVSNTGPKQQLMLLEHLLATNGDSMRVGRLLWMIFEGNDLENSYDELRGVSTAPSTGLRARFEGTVAEVLMSVPGRLRNESVLRRLLDGELWLSARGPDRSFGGRMELDGARFETPLFHSRRWGYRLFNPNDVERATKPREYVLEHPHRPLLDQTFADMKALSERNGFRVTVLVAPSDVRVYGADFEGFPALSEKPHFIDYVVELSRRTGFGVVNLLPLLQPFAERELLYYRDDHHWNERGNAIVAQLIRDALAAPRH